MHPIEDILLESLQKKEQNQFYVGLEHKFQPGR